MIRSPVSGVVVARNVDLGQTVAASFQTPELFVIASDLTVLKLTVDIDKADIGGVQVGQTATFTVDAYPARTFAAGVTELRNAARTVANVVTYQGVLDVNNKAGLLKPGMTATADIVVRTVANVISVPNRALRFAPPKPPVRGGGFIPFASTAAPVPTPGKGELWTPGPNSRPEARPVTLGITDGRRTQITSGNVRAGEAFIVDIVAPESANNSPATAASVEID